MEPGGSTQEKVAFIFGYRQKMDLNVSWMLLPSLQPVASVFEVHFKSHEGRVEEIS
jgi:hypothetical protein